MLGGRWVCQAYSPLSLLCVLSHLSRVQLFVTLWTVAYQAPLSTGFSRQESWSELPFPPPGDLPDPGIKPVSLVAPAVAGRLPPAPLGKPLRLMQTWLWLMLLSGLRTHKHLEASVLA